MLKMQRKEEISENLGEVAGRHHKDGIAVGATRITSHQSRPPMIAPSNETKQLNVPQVQLQQQSAAASTPSVPVHEAPEFRSFWKAGAYAANPSMKPALVQGSLEHARVHPKFLHSNATSHKWAFGAIAELLDNAVDEVQNGATFVKVDKVDIMKDNSPALLFQDDGGGMDPESLRKCMSLGYSMKKANKTIGQYGNGFKTSTMRLGADVIVFSRATGASNATQSVGLLSYTFLRKTGQDDVIVPMIDFDISGHWAEPIIYSSQDDWSFNLKTIIEWSPFGSKSELMQQFEDIGPHGTKVIIYNLWMNDEGIYELSFDDDDEDICLRDEDNQGSLKKLQRKTRELRSHISYCIRYSLRAYASMLYLRKFNNFKIILRGKPIQQFNIADELRFRKVISYKPQVSTALNDAMVETTIGFIKEAPALSVCGFNVYHKNRLIRPFWKVTGDGSSKGNGVVGVLEANFIEPTHDKQDFERSTLFVRLESRLRQMIVEYWRGNFHLIGHQLPGSNLQEGGSVQPPVGNAANMQKQPADQHKNGLESNFQEEANVRLNLRNEQSSVQAISGFTDEDNNEVTPNNHPVSISVDELCEENIRLFKKCEEHMLKEIELKNLVKKLEKEVEQAKLRCTQLSLHVEARKKQKT
ncbi:Protein MICRORCHIDIA like [Melia azedarach]|uniref:Protein MICRORCHIDIA like n=1 Tax=Melia azedarach TaxID=155640 RepID=A0ACC1XT50_MELAZ|nr:Protein MICRORCHIDIA like [Melia azedarach]